MIYVDYQQDCLRTAHWRWDTVSHLTCDPTDDLEPLSIRCRPRSDVESWFISSRA